MPGGGHPDEVLDRFRIAHLAKARPGELSGGERQRVGLARALARDPRRPPSGSSRSRRSTRTRAPASGQQDVLDQLDLPVLLVTHDFQDAAVLADRVGVLVEGRLLQVGAPGELVSTTRRVRRQLHGSERPDRPGGPRARRPRDGHPGRRRRSLLRGRGGRPCRRRRLSVGDRDRPSTGRGFGAQPRAGADRILVQIGNRTRVQVGGLRRRGDHRVRRAARAGAGRSWSRPSRRPPRASSPPHASAASRPDSWAGDYSRDLAEHLRVHVDVLLRRG